MAKQKEICNEFILADEIEGWEYRINDNIKMTKFLEFWRLRYFLTTISVGLLFSFKYPGIALLWTIFLCLFDFLLMRLKARKHFQTQLNELKVLLADGPYDWDKKRNEPYDHNFGKKKVSKASPVYLMRKAWISYLSDYLLENEFKVLDGGCKGGEISQTVIDTGAKIVGII
ncbi:MAG: hypothetical protein JRI91_10745 [Deltaproteobacteria bacterium]|nr:hypothetical protein [Deltaproteobacteria bacterium]